MADPIDTARQAPGLRYAAPAGDTREQMRAWLRDSEEGRALYNQGDCRLVWVNDGDLRRFAHGADTARQEGIALGLEMAKAAPTYDRNFDPMERVDYGAWISVDDIPEPPIPPHVAAARVLLDAMEPAIWRSAIAAMEPILRADIQPTAWNSEDEIMSALTAALEQIAKEEG